MLYNLVILLSLIIVSNTLAATPEEEILKFYCKSSPIKKNNASFCESDSCKEGEININHIILGSFSEAKKTEAFIDLDSPCEATQQGFGVTHFLRKEDDQWKIIDNFGRKVFIKNCVTIELKKKNNLLVCEAEDESETSMNQLKMIIYADGMWDEKKLITFPDETDLCVQDFYKATHKLLSVEDFNHDGMVDLILKISVKSGKHPRSKKNGEFDCTKDIAVKNTEALFKWKNNGTELIPLASTTKDIIKFESNFKKTKHEKKSKSK